MTGCSGSGAGIRATSPIRMVSGGRLRTLPDPSGSWWCLPDGPEGGGPSHWLSRLRRVTDRKSALTPSTDSPYWRGAVGWEHQGRWWQPWRLLPERVRRAHAPRLVEVARMPAEIGRASCRGRGWGWGGAGRGRRRRRNRRDGGSGREEERRVGHKWI